MKKIKTIEESESNECIETINVTLTQRQIEVLTFTALGKTRNEISTILSISEETVKAHLKKACNKLDVVNKTQAAIVALKLGLINPNKNFPPHLVSPGEISDQATRGIPHMGNTHTGNFSFSKVLLSPCSEKISTQPKQKKLHFGIVAKAV